MIFGPYKDTSINMDWNTNIISTMASGTRTPLVADMKAHGAKTVTLSFATGECGSETWGGVPGAAMAAANVQMLIAGDIDYILATGGAAGSFTCSTDAGMATFIDRWVSPNLVGIDYDIEAGQSEAQIGELIQRIIAARAKYPTLRWQLTLATLANNEGSPTAVRLGASAPSSFNIKGNQTLMAVKSRLGFFAVANKLAGVHYWSYDRDIDCPPGPASPTCNSIGGIGPHGFLARFIADGMN